MHVPVLVLVSGHSAVHFGAINLVSVVEVQEGWCGSANCGNCGHYFDSVRGYVCKEHRPNFPDFRRVSSIVVFVGLLLIKWHFTVSLVKYRTFLRITTLPMCT